MLRTTLALLAMVSLLPWTATGCADDGSSGDPGSGGAGAGENGGAGAHDPLADLDGDGHDALEDGGDDCDDTDATIHPGADDTVGDGIDQNCDGIDGVDGDGDGHASEASGGLDCDDADMRVHPGASDDGELGDQIIHTTDWSTQATAIAVDSEGHVHIAFGDKFTQAGNLVQVAPHYVTNATGAWVETAIDSANSSGLGLLMDIHDDVLHVVYSNGLRYASLDTTAAGTWQTTTVAPGYASGLLVDSAGHPHLCSSDSATDTVRHFADLGAGFAETTLTGTNVSTSALALDGDVAVLAFIDDGDVMVASAADGFTPVLAHQGGADGRLAIAVDANGARHIVFGVTTTGGTGELHYATNATGSYVSSKLMDVASRYGTVSLRFDANGVLHAVVGHHHYGNHVIYAVRVPGGAWSVHPLLTNDSTRGSDVSFTLTDDGTVHFAYLDGPNVFYGALAAANGVDDDCDGDVW